MRGERAVAGAVLPPSVASPLPGYDPEDEFVPMDDHVEEWDPFVP